MRAIYRYEVPVDGQWHAIDLYDALRGWPNRNPILSVASRTPVITPTVWAAYLCLLCVVSADVIILRRPLAAYFGRYQRHGRHRPQPVAPHEHQAYAVIDGIAYCDCGITKRLADGNYPQP